MRKVFLLGAVVAALVIPVAAIAAEWDDSKNGDLVALGAACPTGGEGDHAGGAWYHFVLNQVSPDYFGNNPITLTATFDGPPANSDTVDPAAVQKKVIHFDVFGIGELDSAYTTPSGTGDSSNLVLSGVVCGKKGYPDRAGD